MLTLSEINLLKIDLKKELKLYEKVIDLDALELELPIWYNYRENNKNVNWKNMSDLVSFFNSKELKIIFPQVDLILRLYLEE